jgi:hypothetical protein
MTRAAMRGGDFAHNVIVISLTFLGIVLVGGGILALWTSDALPFAPHFRETGGLVAFAIGLVVMAVLGATVAIVVAVRRRAGAAAGVIGVGIGLVAAWLILQGIGRLY